MKVYICTLAIALAAIQLHAQAGGGSGGSSSGTGAGTAPATGSAPPNSASQPLQPNTPPLHPTTPPLQPNPPPLQPNNPSTPTPNGVPDQNVNTIPQTPGAPPNTGYGLNTNNGMVGAYPNGIASNGIPGGIYTNGNAMTPNGNAAPPRRHWWNR